MRYTCKFLCRYMVVCLYAKLSKCEFLLPELVFLEHVISASGITVDPAKVKAILRWEWSPTTTEIWSVFGFTRYYRRFKQGFSSLATPLIWLKKKECFVRPDAMSRVFKLWMRDSLQHNVESTWRPWQLRGVPLHLRHWTWMCIDAKW